MTSSDPTRQDLTSIFLRMGGLLLSEETVQSALDLVCKLARETLPGTSGSGVTLLEGGEKSTAAYSDEIVMRADVLQYDLDEGPCLSAWKERSTYRIESMAAEERWPRWCPAAHAMGMQSSLSVPLVLRGEALGAMKVYSAEPSNYDEHDEQVLAMFAQQAALLLANVRAYNEAQEVGQQLKLALENRDMIGQAKGILMERETIDEERAFSVLREISQRRNEKLRDIAREIVEDKVRKASQGHE